MQESNAVRTTDELLQGLALKIAGEDLSEVEQAYDALARMAGTNSRAREGAYALMREARANLRNLLDPKAVTAGCARIVAGVYNSDLPAETLAALAVLTDQVVDVLVQAPGWVLVHGGQDEDRYFETISSPLDRAVVLWELGVEEDLVCVPTAVGELFQYGLERIMLDERPSEAVLSTLARLVDDGTELSEALEAAIALEAS